MCRFEYMNAKLLDTANNLSAFTAGDDRYELSGVHLAEKFTEATDGRILVRCSYPPHPVEGFPTVTNSNELKDGTVLSKDSIKVASKTLPKSPLFPALSCLRVSNAACGANLETTDSKGRTAVVTAKAIECEFPKTDSVIPPGKPEKVVSLSADYLEKIAKYAKQCGSDSIHLGVRGELDCVEFAIQSEGDRLIAGLVMPLRASGEIQFLSGIVTTSRTPHNHTTTDDHTY